jgi:DNA mismatch repair ATPase MutS
MEKELIHFIKENSLSPFNNSKTDLKINGKNIFKTNDARAVHRRVLSKISSEFAFHETSNLLNYFQFTESEEEIKKRQKFFKRIRQEQTQNNSFLLNLSFPKREWKPKYDLVVVTENIETFNELKNNNCPVQILLSENDVISLQERDLVQVIDCEEFSRALEGLSQAIFINSLEEAYMERHLEELSAWKKNFELLKNQPLNSEIKRIIDELLSLLEIIEEKNSKKISRIEIEEKIERINKKMSLKLKEMTISGDSLVEILQKGVFPQEIRIMIQNYLKEEQIPFNLVNIGLPVKVDEEELEKIIQKQNSEEYLNISRAIKKEANRIIQIPKKLQELKNELILFDFKAGILNFTKKSENFPEICQEFSIKDSENIFLENPQKISFFLNEENRCSILTGANSGGKTTLVEHIIQIISLFQLGFPIKGEIKTPIFTEVYYFAKNKGAMNKGAFENLLEQMSKISPGNKTLILADEIEAVTEPGVAGKIIAATADFYIKKSCFLVIATHLGQEIQKVLPALARIDGIESKGLNEKMNLIIDHNPVIGRIAHSTPELIVEKLAYSRKEDYFKYIHEWLKKPLHHINI